jgi:hypothetical protein
MSQTYEQVETAVEVVSETVISDRNRGVETVISDRNRGVERIGTAEQKEKKKVKKIPINHNSKDTMNTAQERTTQEYEEITFKSDEIPAQDEFATIIKIDVKKPKRKYVRKNKLNIVVDKEDPVVPLPLVSDKESDDEEKSDKESDDEEESDKESDKEDEEQEDENTPIAVLMERKLTQEENELEDALKLVQEATEKVKTLKKKVAINKKRENIAELRAEKVKVIDAGIEKMEQQLASMKARRDEILEGKLDEVILSSTFAPKEKKSVKHVRKTVDETGKKYVRPKNYAEMYIPKDAELKQTLKGKVFSVIFDGKVFKGECGEFETLRQANIAHCESLDIKWYPDAWKSFTLNGESIYRLDL